MKLTDEELLRLENFGFTKQGAAIVDATWFTQMHGLQVGMVLICNSSGVWKCYIGTPSSRWGNEKEEAQDIAEYGCKVPYAIAKAAFSGCPFDNLNYDFAEVAVQPQNPESTPYPNA